MTTQVAGAKLLLATPAHLDALLGLVRAYHVFEHVELSDAARLAAIAPLLTADNPFGRIWLIQAGDASIGYAAVCFGYSIEFAGRDGFLDELFIDAAWRGRGIGSAVLSEVQREVAALGIGALHLEVARDNAAARGLYSRLGFEAREGFHLMSWRTPQPL